MTAIETTIPWKLEIEHGAGSLMWTSSEHPFVIYASPFYENNEEGIVVQVDDKDCDTIYSKVVAFPGGDPIFWNKYPMHNLFKLEKEDQFKKYLEIMRKEFFHILQETVYENT